MAEILGEHVKKYMQYYGCNIVLVTVLNQYALCKYCILLKPPPFIQDISLWSILVRYVQTFTSGSDM